MPSVASIAHSQVGPPIQAGALGSRAARFGAQFIDAAVLLIPVVMLASGVERGGSLVIGIIYLSAIMLYAPLMLARPGAHNGQTLGKQLVGVRVMSLDGGEVTFGQAFAREAVGRSLLALFSLGFYGLADSAWCLWDRRKQTLHDKIAGTIVVKG